MNQSTDHVPNRPRQRTIFDETVSSRIEALLARTDRLKRGIDIDRPVTFNREGERHAMAVAAREAGGTPPGVAGPSEKRAGQVA